MIYIVYRFMSGKEIKKKKHLFGLRIRVPPVPQSSELWPDREQEKGSHEIKIKGRKSSKPLYVSARCENSFLMYLRPAYRLYDYSHLTEKTWSWRWNYLQHYHYYYDFILLYSFAGLWTWILLAISQVKNYLICRIHRFSHENKNMCWHDLPIMYLSTIASNFHSFTSSLFTVFVLLAEHVNFCHGQFPSPLWKDGGDDLAGHSRRQILKFNMLTSTSSHHFTPLAAKVEVWNLVEVFSLFLVFHLQSTA